MKKPRPSHFSLVVAGIMLTRFVMRRIRPSALIRARDLHTTKDLAKLGLTQEVFDDLPRQSFHSSGKPMEPMNLMLVGSEEAVTQALRDAGWHKSDKVSTRSLARAFFAIIFDQQYLTGPITPLFIDNQREYTAIQKPTKLNKFRERHHARLWSTEFQDTNGQNVWIAHASYDRAIKGSGIFNFPPTHEIDPRIDKERDLLAKDLVAVGAKLRGYLNFQKPHAGKNAFGDHFETDGRIVVVEIPNAT